MATRIRPPRLRIINPATGERVAALDSDTRATVEVKYAAARAAQPAWAALPLRDRTGCLLRFREKIVRHSARLAAILTREVGKPIRQSRNELRGLLDRIDFFTAETPRALRPQRVLAQKSGSRPAMFERIAHEPLGVIANVSAWNYPYFVGSNVFIPALLCGNAVLYKPSEYATLTGLEIARLLHQSGVPTDVFTTLVGAGEVGAALLDQPIDGVYFTGSYPTGQRIAAALAPRLVRVQLELGGKDPVYVCDDVGDVAGAAAVVADGAFYNTGQSCCSVERIYVHEKIFEAFVDAFVVEVKRFRVGDPRRPSTYIGPLTRREQLAVLEAQVADAVQRGARVLTGGRRIRGPGNFFQPTVLVDVDHAMAVMRDESFGPVIGIMRTADDAQAIGLMNDTAYGLTAAVFTPNRRRAGPILAAMRTGSVYWNCCDRVSPRLPWSGRGHSGLGFTLSRAGITAFTQPKAWHLKSGC